MSSRSSASAFLLACLAASGTALVAQAPPPIVTKGPDTPAVTRHIDAATTAAGVEWGPAVEFICKPNQDRANRADDPVITPTKLFDNVYAIGRTSTVVYAVTTSAG